jgi:N-acetylmuramoyl-L-alanine amidase
MRNTTSVRVVAVHQADTVSIPFAAPELVDPDKRIIGVLRTAAAFESDTDRVVIGRPIPDGTYKWILFPGTPVEITGKQGEFTRVRLDANLEIWVANADVAPLDSGTPMPRRVTGGMRVNPAKEWADVVIPMANRPAFLVEPDDHKLLVTLYGTQMNPEISPIIGNDTLIRQISWEQATSDRVRLELRLSQPVYGWLSLWDESRHAMIIRVRRIPVIDRKNPLAGMVIAVDPGHPPAGATGPTGLFEGDAVLPVAELVAQLLREKGATPVMTRTTRAAVGLTERTVTSRRANANAFVSVHLNAFGDGVNPFVNNGTSTLFFHQSSEPLARPVQRELMKRLGLRDLGVHYQNLAVARPTWYPAVLTEGAFVIMPEQEAAMRNPVYQRRFAEGIVAGLEIYFRELAQQ